MGWAIAVGIGLAFGTGAGLVAERLPLPSVLQSLAAAFTAMVLSAFGVVLVWLYVPSGSGGLGAVSIGTDTLFTLIVCALVVVGLHVLLGRLHRVWPAVVRHRPVILGCLGGLCAALPIAWAMAAALRA